MQIEALRATENKMRMTRQPRGDARLTMLCVQYVAAAGFIVDNDYVVAFVCLCLKAGKGDAKK